MTTRSSLRLDTIKINKKTLNDHQVQPKARYYHRNTKEIKKRKISRKISRKTKQRNSKHKRKTANNEIQKR
jgi:hypothetical protein